MLPKICTFIERGIHHEKNALLSVCDKTGIADFAEELIYLGWNILSSGGTAETLRKAGIAVTDVAEITGRSAILGHRVVTLGPEIHGGLLATSDMLPELEALGYPYIDLVCVDSYPLQAEINNPNATPESIIEKTDIGGPALIRSGAKGRRIVVCDPTDRERVLHWLRAGRPNNGNFRNELAAKAEKYVADYCLLSACATSASGYYGLIGTLATPCKYGENPYQTPAPLYSLQTSDSLAINKFKTIEGTPPSFINLVDINRLLQTTTHIAEGFWVNGKQKKFIAVGVKHGNPCGAAISDSQDTALTNMMAGNPLAIFGGLILVNFKITKPLAQVLKGKLLDGIIAPAFTSDAINLLRRKTNKCRFITNLALENLVGKLDTEPIIRPVRGGFLTQPNYTFVPNFSDDTQITKYGNPSQSQINDMVLAWAIGSTSNSNTITIVKDGMLLGNGTGQQDRVGAANLAITQAVRSEHDLKGAVAYSDSFFPFPDCPQALIDAGIRAIFTSSGSVNDRQTIDLCVKNGIVLCMVPDTIGRGFFGH